MKVEVIPVTPFEQNCSILICPETKKAVVVDPGGDLNIIQARINQLELSIESILITHGHIDHCGGTSELQGLLGVPVQGPHKDDQFWISQLNQQGIQFGLHGSKPFVPDRWLNEGDSIVFGYVKLTVLHCPGHTPGHVVFLNHKEKFAIVGDVLFKGSIGRTDFPRGNYELLISSITKKLWPLGEDITFLPGHGPMSTFGEERQTNPLVGDYVLGG